MSDLYKRTGVNSEHVTYLCQAWGESDLPEVKIVKTLAEARDSIIQFCWNPVSDAPNEARDAMYADFDQQMEDDDCYKTEFEIGGISVTPVVAEYPNWESAPLLPQQGEQTAYDDVRTLVQGMFRNHVGIGSQGADIIYGWNGALGQLLDYLRSRTPAIALPQVGEAHPNNELIKVADRHLCAAYQAGSDGIEFDLLVAKREIEAAAPVAQALPTDHIAKALRDFMQKAGYLRHPDVPYFGTNNGDSEEAWKDRLYLAAANAIVAQAMPVVAEHRKDAHDAKRWRAVRALPMAGIYELWVHSNSLETLDRNADIASEEIQRMRTRSVDAAIDAMQGEKA